MANKIKGVLIEPNKGLRIVEINDEVEEYHKLLNCRTFDIQRITVDGKEFDVYIDDEGKFIEDNEPTVVLYYDGQPYDMIVGKAFFTDVNLETGETISLNEDQINHLLKQQLNTIGLKKNPSKRFKVLNATY